MKGIAINDFVRTLEEQNRSLAEFSDTNWILTIEKGVVYEDETIEFEFKNGNKIRV